ncbi:MAG: winged helix-turn-helix transcriptional regulator [Clostridiales bacterium]|nr:winged helix-turn-helix transcriptional regulator [Clostridiales bacterium]
MHSSHAREYLHISGEIDSIYHELALKFGISDSVLNILYVVCEKGNQCLQSDIFRLTGMSRQTINTAIRKLEKDEILFLKQGPGRNTIVCLTEKGNAFCRKNIIPLFQIEDKIWNEWTDEEKKQYLAFEQKYCDSLKKYAEEILHQK